MITPSLEFINATDTQILIEYLLFARHWNGNEADLVLLNLQSSGRNI